MSYAQLVLALILTTLQAPSEGDLRTFSRPRFGFVAKVPADWIVCGVKEDADRLILDFGLPEVWSEREQQKIENSIAITAYRRPEVRSVADVTAIESERVADILVSRQPVESPLGSAFVVITTIQGLRYKSLSTYHFANGVGYVVTFTATEGTYPLNVGKCLAFIQNLRFSPPTKIQDGQGS